MSTINVTQPDVSVSLDNTTFDVQSGASLNLTGTSDYVILESGSGGGTVTGNNNTVSGAAVNGVDEGVSGTGNSLTLGANCSAEDSGSNNTITIGANSHYQGEGTNSTIYATAGGDWLTLRGSGETAYANNDNTALGADIATVNGNGNQILGMGSFGQTLNLGGSNNVVNLAQGLTVTTNGGGVTENTDGTVVLSGNVMPGSATLSGGVLTLQLGNGNVATMSGVSSGTQIEYLDATGKASWTTLTDSGLGAIQANRLASAMASYSPSASASASNIVMPVPTSDQMLACAQHQVS